MLVAIVVPWNTWASCDGAVPALSQSSRIPCTVACEGSAGDPAHRRLRGAGGGRGDLVEEDLSRLVVDVDQVGEGAPDVDAQPLHAAAPGLRTILPKCSRRSIVSIASRACSSG